MSHKSDITRRTVLNSVALVPAAALAQQPAAPPAVEPKPPTLDALSPAQMKTLEAFIDRLIPSDELGPGAVEAGAQIYIDRQLAGFLASATAAVALAEPLVPALGFLGGAAEVVAVAGVTLILTFLTLVLGELAPKRLAMQMALPWARAVARPLDLLATLSRPVVWMLGVATNTVVRLLGGRAEAANEELSPDELREIVTTHQGLGPEQREIITGAFDIQERTLREVLVPRSQTLFLRQAG